MRSSIFRDRRDAGRQLAARLASGAYGRDGLVMGIPRGGVVVAREVAAGLGWRLDVCIVRKLGAPGHEELAFGAVAATGAPYLDAAMVRSLGLGAAAVETVIARERAEVVRREVVYRQGRPAPIIAGTALIVVDDGIATGADMLAAVRVLRLGHPASMVVAVPVAPAGACNAERFGVDAMVCLQTPEDFYGVGQFYADFRQVTDQQVTALLAEGKAA